MKLGEIFKQEEGEPVIGKSIIIPLLKPTGEGTQLYKVKGVFHILTELDRREAARRAEASLKEEYKETPYSIPEEARALEHVIWHMIYSIYTPEDDRKRLLDKDVETFRKCITTKALTNLNRAYNKFVEDEFPEDPTEEQFGDMVTEAVKK